MCLLSVPHLPDVPRDLGAVGLGGTPETWRTGAQCLSEANDGLPNQGQLSFQAQPLWVPIPCLPNVLHRHQYSSSISHSMGLPPGHCSHCSFFHPSPPFLYLMTPFKSQLKQHFPCGTAPDSLGDLLHAWFILYPPLWHPFNALSVFACLTPITL